MYRNELKRTHTERGRDIQIQKVGRVGRTGAKGVKRDSGTAEGRGGERQRQGKRERERERENERAPVSCVPRENTERA